MTKEGETHHGSVFFPLPDGSAVLYKLEGQAEAPGPVDTIARTFAAKANQVVELDVANWLKQPQRFRVDIRPAEGTDPSTKLGGHEHVDVPANQSRAYRLAFFAYKEATTNVDVYFINDKNGEYLFYKLSLTTTSSGVLDTISMQAPLRQLTSHALPLTNPLDVPVSFTATVNSTEVTVAPSVEVPAKGKVEFLDERPLPQETTSQPRSPRRARHLQLRL